MSIDYSKYTTAELIQAKNSINPDKNPKNYKALMNEYNNRDIEKILKNLPKEQERKAILDAKTKVNIVGYYQLISAAVLLLMATWTLYNGTGNPVLFASAMLIAIVLNITAGYTAIKKMTRYYWLSIINQALQVVNFSLGKLTYFYAGFISFAANFKATHEVNVSIGVKAHQGLMISLAADPATGGVVSINIIAIIFIVALVTAIKHN